MSELNLSTLTQTEKDVAPTAPIKQIDDALRACKFGRFNIRLLLSAGIALISGILVTNSIAYLLPNAECDLNMDLEEKGLLTASPFFGMLLSSVVAGFLTDTFGRKIFILIGCGGLFILNLIAASSQTYTMLFCVKFMEGLLFAISFTPTMTMPSEFLHNGIRDRVMLCQSSFSGLSQVIIAALSWPILTKEWNYTFFDGKFVLHTWNFYLYLMSLFSLASFIMFAILPESPKYLVTQKRYEEAREILIKIYVENTGKPADTYPYKNIWKDEQMMEEKTPQVGVWVAFAKQVKGGLHNSKQLFKNPYLLNLALFCFSLTCSLVLYNTIRLWFPQLSTIVEHANKNGIDQDLCVMLDDYTDIEKIKKMNTSSSEICVPKHSGSDTYINSIILGFVGVIPYLINGVLVKKVGKKALTLVTGLMTIASTIGVRFSNNEVAVVSLFSIDAAMAQSAVGLFQITAMNYFPTTTRTLAFSIIMMSGRIGTLLGNIAFPILLNMGCAVPFYSLAGMMILVTLVALFIKFEK